MRRFASRWDLLQIGLALKGKEENHQQSKPAELILETQFSSNRIGLPLLHERQSKKLKMVILWELNRINEYCGMMRRPPLFRQTFWQAERPRNFCFLIRPTAKEFVEFCQTLDKMMSENINREFFRGEVSEKLETVRADGKIVVTTKGTIALLKEWLLKNWHPKDPVAFEDGFSIFKEVRDLRNPQAHKLIDDVFDQKYLAEQRTLLTKVYEMMHALRFILESHPRVKSQVKDDDGPEKGEIFIY